MFTPRAATIAVDLVTVGRMQVALPRGYLMPVEPHALDNGKCHMVDGLSLIPTRYRAVCEARRQENLNQPLAVIGTSLVLVGCELSQTDNLVTQAIRWRTQLN